MEFLLSLVSHINVTPDTVAILLLGLVVGFAYPAVRTAWRGGK